MEVEGTERAQISYLTGDFDAAKRNLRITVHLQASISIEVLE